MLLGWPRQRRATCRGACPPGLGEHLVHVQAAVRDSERNLPRLHGLRQRLPRVPLGLVDLVVYKVAERGVLAAHELARGVVRGEALLGLLVQPARAVGPLVWCVWCNSSSAGHRSSVRERQNGWRDPEPPRGQHRRLP
jgi:hypothetical protein